MGYTASAAQTALIDKVMAYVDALDAPGSSITARQSDAYGHAEQASRDVILTVAPELLSGLSKDGLELIQGDVIVKGGGVAVPLPSGFLRLLSLELDGYGVAITHEDIATSKEEAYRAFVRGDREGDTDYPAAFRIPYGLPYTEALHCFPVLASPRLTSFLYVAETAPEKLSGTLKESMLWRAAMYVLTAIDPETAARAEARSLQVLEAATAATTPRLAPREQRVTTRPYVGL